MSGEAGSESLAFTSYEGLIALADHINTLLEAEYERGYKEGYKAGHRDGYDDSTF